MGYAVTDDHVRHMVELARAEKEKVEGKALQEKLARERGYEQY